MAYQTGNLTSHANFLVVLKAFLTSSAVGWTCIKDTNLDTIADSADIGTTANVNLGRVIYFSAPGLDYTKTIYTCFWEFKNTVTGYYNIGVRCMTSYSSLYKKESQTGVSPPHYLCMTNAASSPYWFIANSQRVMCLVNSGSGTYRDCLYAGWLTPNVSAAAEVPLPYAVGGSSATSTNLVSSNVTDRRAFFNPYKDSDAATPICTAGEITSNGGCTLSVRTTSSGWLKIGNGATQTATAQVHAITSPYAHCDSANGYHNDKNYGSSPMEKTLLPISIWSDSNTYQGCYGELDGVYHVSGEGMSPQDVISISGVDYLVWNSVNQTGRNMYAAFKLA